MRYVLIDIDAQNRLSASLMPPHTKLPAGIVMLGQHHKEVSAALVPEAYAKFAADVVNVELASSFKVSMRDLARIVFRPDRVGTAAHLVCMAACATAFLAEKEVSN
jgi:hypothetical protein